jgi:sortase A
MTSTPRRLPLFGAVALLAAAALAVGGWAIATDDEPGNVAATAPVVTTTAPPQATTTTTTTIATTTTTAPPVTLPMPEAAPVDAYAPTPDVVIGRIELPTIGLADVLHQGVTITAIDRGPSHWPGTALPGEPGNVVVAGHRVTHSRPFHDLDRLQVGDPLVFTRHDGSRASYELTGIEIVAPDAMHIIEQTPDSTATLFACHPKGSASQRIVARFRLVGA